jgi:hypothetical protein
VVRQISGILESWNTGMLGSDKKDGIMEYWGNGMMGLEKKENICRMFTHYSNIPPFHGFPR